MKNKIPISVIVSVKNEELNLPKCLKNLHVFSEVIVVDSNSTDKTPEIVKSFNFKLINFNWNGRYPKKRNWALDNLDLINDWILFLDADEFLTEKIINEISTKLEKTNHSGFLISYNNYFMGKEQKFGTKMRKLALFRKDRARFERIDESNWSHLDMEIHEHPIVNGTVGKIKNTIIHKDFKGLSHYLKRHNEYSDWEAKRYLNIQNSNSSNFILRQRLKYYFLESNFMSIFYFINSYIFQLGFLDGKTGYYFARYKSFYFTLIRTKILELKTKKTSNRTTL
jgi:glycosyltransferase involved in cell wall biosynthesis